MACYSPWVPEGAGGTRPFSCGKCHGCRLERSRQWGVRCMHEAKLHASNCFITLTYRDACFSLVYSDFQRFMKRLRARFRVRIRFYMAGEYTKLSRPHWHACLFGFDFPDKFYHGITDAGSKLYRSHILEELWPYGFSSIGELNFKSAAYVARYCMKKVYMYDEPSVMLGIIDPDTGEIFERVREFSHMSLKPGIGEGFYRKFKSDMYPDGHVVVNAKLARAPRYYDKLFRLSDAGGYMRLCVDRARQADKAFAESAPSRLSAREAVSKARLPKGTL